MLELRGDEALVVFGSPRSAIRGAVALQQRFVEETIADPSLPLTVGIGLDAGEAVAVEGGYRGGALNVAARLCSLARAGEVLASREIVHLALRVDGVRFTERGQAALKGLEKPVHVVAVRSEERDEALAIAPFVRSIAPSTSHTVEGGCGGGRVRRGRRVGRHPLGGSQGWGQLGDRAELGRRPGPGIRRGHRDGRAGGEPGVGSRIDGRRLGDQPRRRYRHADRPERAGDPRLDPGGREPDGDRRRVRRGVGRGERRALGLPDQPRHEPGGRDDPGRAMARRASRSARGPCG